jgi:hypothetical protein
MWEGVVGRCVGVNEATSGVRTGITKPDNKTVWWHCWLFTISYPYISCRHGDCLGWYRWMQSSSLYLVNMKDGTPYLHCILLCKVLRICCQCRCKVCNISLLYDQIVCVFS